MEEQVMGRSKDVVYFARTDFRGAKRLFGIKRRDRRQHTYVMGKSGTGKTVLLHNMVVQDIVNGEGVCVVDPHGEFVESLIDKIPRSRLKDVVYFNPADSDYHLGFNVLDLPDPKYKHLVASGLMAIFTKIWANVWSARMEYIMNNAILALLETPGSTLLGINRILVDKDFRQKIIANVKDPVVRAFWVNEYESWRDQFRNEAIAPIQNKVGQFLSTGLIRNVVGQSQSTIDIFDIMNSRKIFLVNVSKGRIGEDNSALLGAMLITKIQLTAMERVRIPEEERKDFYLYVDEFQNFATDSFAGILSEARKYRLNLILAHQYIGQLVTDVSTKVRDAVFGNVGTMMIFRVGAADAEFLENEFSPELTIEDMVNLPGYHIYLRLLVDGVSCRPFSAETLPPFNIPTNMPVASHEEIIDTSRRLYAKHRDVVEKEISSWSSSMGDFQGDSYEPRPRAMETASVSSSSPSSSSGGIYPIVCSLCGKSSKVNFKPTPGRPVYCTDCFTKIKAGELEELPIKVEEPEEKFTTHDREALADLGIEFESESKEVTPPPVKRSILSEEKVPTPSNPGKAGMSLNELKGKTPKVLKPKTHTDPDIAGLREALKHALHKEEEK